MAVEQARSIPSNCDVAVIGGGIGGLTAAAVLARAGLDVSVFEAGPQPGGYLAAFERRGFVFDPSIQWLNQCRPGGLVYRILSRLGSDFPRCRPLERVARCKGDSFDYLLTARPAALRDRLIAQFPDDARGIRRFFGDAARMGERWESLNDQIRSWEDLPLAGQLRYGFRMTRQSLPMWRYARESADEGLRRYFRNPDLRKLFCREKAFISVMMPIGWAFSGDFQAPPAGGGQALAKWLVRVIESAGSRVCTGCRVVRVQVDGANRAVGVVLDGGRAVAAGHVVAASDQQELFENLLPPGAIPPRLRAAVRDADVYYSCFSVFLGLDCDPVSLGFNEEVLYLVHEDVPRGEQSGGEPQRTAVTVIAPSVRDPSLAPRGKGTLAIHCPAYLSQHGVWKTEADGTRGESYRAFKQAFADTLIDRVEKQFAPGLRKHIEVMEAATPVTYRRYTGNRGGSAMGTSPTRKNILSRVARIRTPVRNLLLGGHWAEYGGGVPIAIKAGANAGVMILKKTRPAAYAEWCDAMDRRAVRPIAIGIPRALGYFLHPGLWETFFRELGMTVVVSLPSSRGTVERAGLISESEHCLPVKMFDAHLDALVGHVDAVFVPRILSTLAGHIACPKLGAVPDAARAQIGGRVDVLTVDIDENRTPLGATLVELGRRLGADDAAAGLAARRALAEMQARRRAPASSSRGNGRRLLVLAHPYNLHDDYLSGPVLRKLETLDVGVDLVGYDVAGLPEGPVRWDTCGIMHEALRRLDPSACAGVVHLSSFNCGCDSIVGALFQGLLKEKGIPYMTLVLDEHSGQAGIETRLEAFVDSIRWRDVYDGTGH